MPGYHRNRRTVGGPEGYLEAVTTGKLRDPVVGSQLRNGFEIRGVLKGYLPEDKRSAGNAALMVRSEEHTSELQSLMRISYAVFCLNKQLMNEQQGAFCYQ